jgi:hypothetical protein
MLFDVFTYALKINISGIRQETCSLKERAFRMNQGGEVFKFLTKSVISFLRAKVSFFVAQVCDRLKLGAIGRGQESLLTRTYETGNGNFLQVYSGQKRFSVFIFTVCL